MNIDEETNKKIQDLQLMEQSFQNLLLQKQTFQVEANETGTSLEEIDKSKGDTYRVFGHVMIKADKNSLKKELNEKKELLALRLKAIEKQELSLREEIERLRAGIMEKIK